MTTAKPTCPECGKIAPRSTWKIANPFRLRVVVDGHEGVRTLYRQVEELDNRADAAPSFGASCRAEWRYRGYLRVVRTSTHAGVVQDVTVTDESRSHPPQTAPFCTNRCAVAYARKALRSA